MNKKPSITQHGSDIMSSTSLYYTTILTIRHISEINYSTDITLCQNGAQIRTSKSKVLPKPCVFADTQSQNLLIIAKVRAPPLHTSGKWN